MFFVVMPNGNHREHLGMFCIVMPSIFVNRPAVICLPNIASYLRETPLVICGPRSYLLHTVFPHCATDPLFCKTGGIDNLSVSSWAKFWFVSVQVPHCWRGERHFPATALFQCHPNPTGSITLGRLLKGNLLLSTS